MSENTEVLLEAQAKGYHIRDMLSLEEDSDYLANWYKEMKYIELCLVQRWLREKHRIEIGILPYEVENYSLCIHKEVVEEEVGRVIGAVYLDKSHVLWQVARKGFKTYEAALLEGIKEALKLITDEPNRRYIPLN